MEGMENISFGDFFNDASGVISDDFINSMADAGMELSGSFGEKLSKFVDEIMPSGGSNAFQKADVFGNTDELKAQLSGIVFDAFESGGEMSKKAGTTQAPPAILNTLTGGSAKVIADSLAKVGGSGNFLRVGMSLSEQSALRTAKATEQTAKATEALLQTTKEKQPTRAPLGR